MKFFILVLSSFVFLSSVACQSNLNNESSIGTRMTFHRIEPGQFKMGEIGNQVDVIITKPFDMAATLTTQSLWRRIAELANAKYPTSFNINPDPSKYEGDTRPVEQVSHYDIAMWISALNQLSLEGEPTLAFIIPDHRTSDVYRFPTEAEWEFVVRGRGQYNDTYYFGNDVSLLGEYAWFHDNSLTNKYDKYWPETQLVAQKKPLVIDAHEFYDMIGNVEVWVHDFYTEHLPGGTDPQGPSRPDCIEDGSDNLICGSKRQSNVIRGGSMLDSASDLRSASRYSPYSAASRLSGVGFRLVRNSH